MRIALVAMPWAQHEIPAPALGTLAGFVRREAPECHLDCIYAYLEVYQRLESVYELLAMDARIGDFIYAAHLYPEQTAAVQTSRPGWRG
jgi:hypothetical protein